MKFLTGNNSHFKFHVVVLLFLVVLFAGNKALSQNATVFGSIKDSLGTPLGGVNVVLVGSATGTTTNDHGVYTLVVPSDKNITIAFSYLGLVTEKHKLFLSEGQKQELNYALKPNLTRLRDVVIQDEQHRTGSMKKLDPKIATLLPNASGNFEAILKPCLAWFPIMN